MDENPPEPDDKQFGIVEQYDSLEDPALRSDFLDAMGTTRSYINALRLRRDAARKAAKADPGPDCAVSSPAPRGDEEPERREPRMPRRSRGIVTRPPNNTGGVRRRRRNRERPVVVIIIFRLD
ncbi:hypothetical protein [Streptomyces sp. NPDC053726]|uniref:hypothetical protein n=1 Tax=Streptomyces sp. NPDC053726 TaxID=3365713 RepID=UPI0037D2130C